MAIDLSAFIHEKALVEDGATIGPRTRIWAFTHVLSGSRIGEDCNICDYVFIESGASIGDRVTIKCGVQIWDGVNIKNDVFVGPNVSFTNDKNPPSPEWPKYKMDTIIEDGASIGAGAIILPGIRIGKKAKVGAGCVVTKSVPDGALVTGNPGRVS